MTTTTRAKFVCRSVEQTTDAPVPVMSYSTGKAEPTGATTWPRTYRFHAVYDTSVPENERYAQATPTGSIEMRVDNPAVVFEPGKSYYLDFTPAE